MVKYFYCTYNLKQDETTTRRLEYGVELNRISETGTDTTYYIYTCDAAVTCTISSI